MCWADRAAFTLFAFIFLALYLIDDTKEGFFVAWKMGELGELFIIMWLPLRLIDWLIGGPARRAIARRHSPLSPSA